MLGIRKMLFLKSILIKIIKNNQNFFHRRYVVVPQKAMADGNLRHSGRMWRMVFSTHRKMLAHTEFNNDSDVSLLKEIKEHIV